jgi:hypothetical protein
MVLREKKIYICKSVKNFAIKNLRLDLESAKIWIQQKKPGSESEILVVNRYRDGVSARSTNHESPLPDMNVADDGLGHPVYPLHHSVPRQAGGGQHHYFSISEGHDRYLP